MPPIPAERAALIAALRSYVEDCQRDPRWPELTEPIPVTLLDIMRRLRLPIDDALAVLTPEVAARAIEALTFSLPEDGHGE